MNSIVYGIDIAKNVFQLHTVDMTTGEVINKQVKRAVFLEHFVNHAPCLIGMEACGGAQHWARKLTEMGHEVKLMSAKFVKAFVNGNKSDAADARGIWVAVQQHGTKFIAVKTEAQQAILALHRMRKQLVKFRTMQSNALRGLLAEYGEVMGVGRAALNKVMNDVLARLNERLPAILIDTLREQYSRLTQLDEEIGKIERRLTGWLKENPACKTIAKIPGVGLLTATAAVATMGDPKSFKSGAEFAAFLGLVPSHTGTGGKIRQLGMSGRGDTYLRTLLIHGARAVLIHAKQPGAWIEQISKRRPANVVTVALANKMARTIWALLANDRQYQKDFISVKPA